MHSLHKNTERRLCYADAIREGTDQAMQELSNIIVIGEGEIGRASCRERV